MRVHAVGDYRRRGIPMTDTKIRYRVVSICPSTMRGGQLQFDGIRFRRTD